ncbi:hypothetical protein [Salinimicrobium gaetbulicola]|uniref:DUF4168 domain-containing protein n=1 Tax=Salinimicrobium gaetbulicola TaxID=999702 RepID=A0ABW3IFQ8_9FLAO
MKMKRNYQLIIVFTVAFLTTAVAVSQNMTQQDPDKELKEVAREAVDFWEKELVLSPKQVDLMEKKIIEFAIKKNRLIQSKMREEAKNERLAELQQLEYRDMRDILTEPQYEKYLKISKQRIQEQKHKHRK